MQWIKNRWEGFLDYFQNLPSVLADDLRSLLLPRAQLSRTTQFILLLLGVSLLVGVYTYLAYSGITPVLPKWDKIWEGFKYLYWDEWFEQHILWEDTKASLPRLIPAVAITGVLGTILGLYMGVWFSIDSLLSKILEFVGGIPPIFAMMVFISIFKFGWMMYVSILIFGTITLVAASVYVAARKIKGEQIDLYCSQGVSSTEIVWSLLFRELLPDILVAVRSSIAPSIIYLAAAENESGNSGWGHSFMFLARAGRIEVVIPYLMVFGIAMICVRICFDLLDRLINPWNHLEAQ